MNRKTLVVVALVVVASLAAAAGNPHMASQKSLSLWSVPQIDDFSPNTGLTTDSFTPTKSVTITRVELRFRSAVPQNCSVLPIYGIRQGGTTVLVYPANGQNTSDTGVIAVPLVAGVPIESFLHQASAGCSNYQTGADLTVQFES